MENFNDEYYLVYRVNNPNYPAVELNEDENEIDLRWETEPIEDCDLVKMKFMEPYPKKSEMVDFHSDGITNCFSQKIYAILNSLSIYGVQLLHGEVLNPKKKEVYNNYYYLHTHNYIQCLDKVQPEFVSAVDGDILSISKIVLNQGVLSKIPQAERLIFRLDEMSSFQLFHQSVVNAIMATEPQGIRFVKASDYHTGSAFE